MEVVEEMADIEEEWKRKEKRRSGEQSRRLQRPRRQCVSVPSRHAAKRAQLLCGEDWDRVLLWRRLSQIHPSRPESALPGIAGRLSLAGGSPWPADRVRRSIICPFHQRCSGGRAAPNSLRAGPRDKAPPFARNICGLPAHRRASKSQLPTTACMKWRKRTASHQARPIQKPTNMSPRRGYGLRVVRRFFPHRAGIASNSRVLVGDVLPRRPMPGTKARGFFGVAHTGMLATGAVAQSADAWAQSSRPAPGTEAPAPGIAGRVASAPSSSAHKVVDTELQTSLSRRVVSLQGALNPPTMKLYNMP